MYTSETVYIHMGVCLMGIVPGGTMLCRWFFWCTLLSFLLIWVFEVSFNSKGTVRHIGEKWSPSFSLRSLAFSSPSFPAVHFSSDFVCVLECVCLSRLCVCVFHRDGTVEMERYVSLGWLRRVQWTGISDGRVETSKAHWNCVRSEYSQQRGCAVKNKWL